MQGSREDCMQDWGIPGRDARWVRVRVGARIGVRFGDMFKVREGQHFLTLHSITYTTTVIIRDYYSKGWLMPCHVMS